jgi:hypothetical protein
MDVVCETMELHIRRVELQDDWQYIDQVIPAAQPLYNHKRIKEHSIIVSIQTS